MSDAESLVRACNLLADCQARLRAAEAALAEIADMTSAAAMAPATADRWLDRIDETARTALGRNTGEG